MDGNGYSLFATCKMQNQTIIQVSDGKKTQRKNTAQAGRYQAYCLHPHFLQVMNCALSRKERHDFFILE